MIPHLLRYIQQKLVLMIRVIAISCFLMMNMSLFAQESWDIEKCINYAWEHSLNVQQGMYGIKGAEINQIQSKHQQYPSLSGNTNVGLFFGRSIDETTNDFSTESILTSNYGLNTGVLLWNGGRIKNGIKQSELDLEASKYDVEQIKRDIALTVGTAYLNALFAEENLSNAQNSLALTEEQLAQIDKLIAAGSRPRNDRLDIVAQLSNDEQQIVAAENNVSITMLGLKQLMNLDVRTDISIVAPPENILIQTDPDLLSFTEVYESALRNQPNIQAGESRLKAAELGIDIAKSQKLPTIGANGQIGTRHSNKAITANGFESITNSASVLINDEPATISTQANIPIFEDQKYFNQLDQNLNYGIGLGANIPIFDNYSSKASVERAKLNVLNTQNQNDQLYQNLRTNVQQVLSDARAAKRALAAAEKTVEARQAAFDNAEKRFQLGAINTFEYVNAKNQFDVSNINYIIAKYDYLFRSKIVDFYMGKMITLD